MAVSMAKPIRSRRRLAAGGRCLVAAMMMLAGALPTGGPAMARTLEESLALAYETNPILRAARAQLRAADEGVPLARSGWHPTVRAEIGAGYTYVDSENRTISRRFASNSNPVDLSMSVTQPIYQGGRVGARLRRARNDVQAERANLFDTEQQVLLQAASAYVDLIRDESVVKLRINNLGRLQKQLEATRDRFRVGEVTKTDVAQAESRVARAEADRTRAEGDLISSRVIYERIIGQPPGEVRQPDMPPGMPASRIEAVETASRDNFRLIRAKFQEQGLKERIDESFGEFLPTVSVIGRLDQSYDTGGNDNEDRALSLTARVRVPMYQGGAVSARVRQAKESANRGRIQVEVTRRSVVDLAARTYEAWQTAQARARSLEAEVESAEIALDGVQQEATVGARTVLDVLDAEQELLNAQVNLVGARRDTVVVAYQLLAALGRMTARNFGLEVAEYDYDQHYRAVETRLFGTGVPSGQP